MLSPSLVATNAPERDNETLKDQPLSARPRATGSFQPCNQIWNADTPVFDHVVWRFLVYQSHSEDPDSAEDS